MEGQAYPAAHDQLNALPLKLLCCIYGNLTVVGAQHMVVRIHQPHSHNILQPTKHRVSHQ